MKQTIAFLCVFMYFASPYRFYGHAMPEIIGLIALILQTIQSRNVLYLKGYGVFMVYMLFVPPLISYVTGLPGNYLTSFIPFNIIFYSALFCILLPNLDMGYVIKYYRVLVIIAVAFFFFQEFAFYTIGARPTFYLPLEMYYEGMDMSSFSEIRETMSRSSSFFLEPAHFAQYILPYYCVVVYNTLKNKKCSWEFLILTAVLFLLQSGCGYVGMLAIFVSVLFIKGLVAYKVKIAMIAALVSGFFVVVYFFINNPIIVELISRLDEVTSLEVDAFGHQSGFLRIWRGYFIYGVLGPVYKLFGVGIGSLDYVANLLYIPGSRYEGSFMNGIQTLLVTGGIIGTSLFFRFIFKMYKSSSYEGRLILICMVSIFFIEHMLFTPKMFLFILIAIAVVDDNSCLFQIPAKTIRSQNNINEQEKMDKDVIANEI